MGSFNRNAVRLFLAMEAVCIGLLLPLESCPWAALVLFAPLAIVLKEEGPLSGFLTGWMFGTAGWAAATFWVVNGMDTMMNTPGWLIPPAALCLWLYQGLPYAGLGLVCGWTNRRGRPAGPLFCAALLTLLVFFRPRLCPISGVVSVALWPRFIQIADLGGETLVFFCMILINFLLADAVIGMVRGKGRQALGLTGWACVLLACILGYGTFCLSRYRDLSGGHPDTRALAVATVQPNAPPPPLHSGGKRCPSTLLPRLKTCA